MNLDPILLLCLKATYILHNILAVALPELLQWLESTTRVLVLGYHLDHDLPVTILFQGNKGRYSLSMCHRLRYVITLSKAFQGLCNRLQMAWVLQMMIWKWISDDSSLHQKNENAVA